MRWGTSPSRTIPLTIKYSYLVPNYIVDIKLGDLVRSIRYQQMGIVVDIFSDLDEENPWIRVLFTHPTETYQWCRVSGIVKVEERKGSNYPPFSGAINSGSL